MAAIKSRSTDAKSFPTIDGRATKMRSTGPIKSNWWSRKDSRRSRRARLRITALPTLPPATMPSLDVEPVGNLSQLATKHPETMRPPCSRKRRKSRPCLIRIARPKPRRWDGAGIESNRRQALAPRAAAAGDGGSTTLGFVARAKTMLALAANFRRLVLAYHNSVKLFRWQA